MVLLFTVNHYKSVLSVRKEYLTWSNNIIPITIIILFYIIFISYIMIKVSYIL